MKNQIDDKKLKMQEANDGSNGVEAMYREIEFAESPQGVKKAKQSRIRTIVGNSMFIALIAILFFAFVSVYTAKEKGYSPSIFGVSLFYVKTGSMEPTIMTGSTIVCVKPSDASKLAVGDVVTFSNTSGVRITHRITEIVKEDGVVVGYRTKGDNPLNSMDEEILTPNRVIAVFAFKLF